MVVKIKKLSINAVIPKYALNGDAGLDLVATSKSHDEKGNTVYGTGLAFAIPKGCVGLLFPRSSNASKDLLLSNSVGVLDSNYRGEVSFKYKKTVRVPYFGTIRNILCDLGMCNKHVVKNCEGDDYKIGDRVGQLIVLPYPKVDFLITEDLGETNRGEGGYGSTGK